LRKPLGSRAGWNVAVRLRGWSASGRVIEASNADEYPRSSYPPQAGYPVRCGLSVQSLTSLEYWIVRPSAQSRTRRTMTAEMWRHRIHQTRASAFSRRVSPEVLQFVHALQSRGRRECRAPLAPAVSCAMCTDKCAHEHTGTAGAARHSLRDGFTAYTVLSLETNSSCLHRRRIEGFGETRLDFAKPPPA
jgi:hypothetical protein